MLPIWPAILESPADDAIRLLFADVLDDSGEPDAVARAEFIRVSVALAKEPETIGHDLPEPVLATMRRTTSMTPYVVTAKRNPRYAALKSREQALLWRDDMPPEMEAMPRPDWAGEALQSLAHHCPGFTRWRFARGFVAEVGINRGHLSHLGAILAENPIEKVTCEAAEFTIAKTANWNVNSDRGGLFVGSREALCEQIGEWIANSLPRRAPIGGTGTHDPRTPETTRPQRFAMMYTISRRDIFEDTVEMHLEECVRRFTYAWDRTTFDAGFAQPQVTATMVDGNLELQLGNVRGPMPRDNRDRIHELVVNAVAPFNLIRESIGSATGASGRG